MKYKVTDLKGRVWEYSRFEWNLVMFLIWFFGATFGAIITYNIALTLIIKQLCGK